LLAELQRRGEAISTMDLLIATAATLKEAGILARNVREFERVPGLRVVAY
jgi:predicted nucleic acid-binding protein